MPLYTLNSVQILIWILFIVIIIWYIFFYLILKYSWKIWFKKEYCPYILKRDFLNKTERTIYAYLISSLPGSVIILPQIPLHSIVQTKIGNDRMTFNKISKKIIDFWFFDKEFKLIALLEFDGPTHSKRDRKDRDNFVDDVMYNLWVPLYHIKYTQDLKFELNTIISNVKKLL
jgi:hypothetical protein